MDVRIVLVGSKFEGNIGSVARSMANFDVRELYLVNPCGIGDDARRLAKHGNFILDSAVIVRNIEDAVKDCFLVAGTSGIVTEGNSNYVRIPISVKEFSERVSGKDEKIAIIFGPEDTGLLQEELAICDVLITIPASREYPVLNVSHAASVIMYELFGLDAAKPIPADHDEKERMFSFFDSLLEDIDYPEHRREGTSIMFRRMIGRSIPTKWEYHTIMGVFGDASRIIRGKKGE